MIGLKNDMSMLSVTLRSITFAWQTNRTLLIVLLLLNLFQGAIVYLQFTSISSIVDEIIKIKLGTGTNRELIRHSVILGLSFLVSSIVANFASHFRIKFRLQQAVQLELYKIDKQGALDIGTIESNSYQALLKGAQEWGSGSVLNLQDFIFTSATNLASIITSIGILWSLNGWLVLFAVLAASPIYFFYKRFSMEVFRIRYLSLDDHRIIGDRVSHFEKLEKAVDVILLKSKMWFRDQIQDRKVSFNKKIIKAEQKKAISYGFISIWYLMFLFAAIALMTNRALTGSIAVGGLLLAFNTYTRFYQTINVYIESISLTEEAARYAARWFELFDLKPKINFNDKAERLVFNEPPLIEFKDVSFQYPGEGGENRYVLRHLTFAIRPGEKIAIVGANGSGKTTLIKLLCRIYDPTEGSILINGKDLKDLNLEDWHRSIGVLFQNFPEYNLTIRQSIGMGRIASALDEEKLKRAAFYSGVDEFIEEFSLGYDQLIWKEFKDGTDLSKGQHQRLAVARMFYRDAPVTILDEPTASIDAVMEEKIFTTLETKSIGKSVIIITHRFSTVKKADKTLILEHGQIIEQGSHKELMIMKGKYAELYMMQAKRYTDNKEDLSNEISSSLC
jgi:ABC-type multidrug transport system fused ATPase/permease subunit